jgi:hypothetical protein
MIQDVKWPTDSLYKFICVFGLSVFLAGCLLYWSLYRGFTDTAIRSQMALSAWVRQLQQSNDSMKAFEKNLRVGAEAMKRREWDKASKMIDANTVPKFDFGDLPAVEKSGGDFFEAVEVFRAYRSTASAMIVLGSIISLAGGYLWYTRIQRYEDQIIRQRATQGI